jgi:hypothetical protein
MASYLSGRTECVRRGTSCSSTSQLVCGVPQGSVLGSVLFILNIADLTTIVRQHALSSHLHADDTQIYGSCRAADTEQFVGHLGACFVEVASWMRSNRLQLNASKTRVPLVHHSAPTAPTSRWCDSDWWP